MVLRVLSLTLFLGSLFFAQGAISAPKTQPAVGPSPPPIESLIKAKVYKEVVEDRDVISSASLDSVPGEEELKHYHFYAVMLVRASVKQTQDTLTNYPQYAKVIPYVDQSDYDPKTQRLKIQGGIFKYVMSSTVQFENRSDRWIHYSIVQGHFTGMEGDIFFETSDAKGTLVYLRGGVSGTGFPPAFIIEKGAEIVLGFAGKRLRNLIQDQKNIAQN